MGGINSLGGLNKVNVDFRPAIDTNAPNNANQPQRVQNDAQKAQPKVAGGAKAKSVVQQLDVLLLNAASKSVAMNAAKQMDDIGAKLVAKNVLSQEEVANLKNLAQKASSTLKKLDGYTGRELAAALAEGDDKRLTWAGRFECVNDYCARNCPSYYTRDFFNAMFM